MLLPASVVWLCAGAEARPWEAAAGGTSSQAGAGAASAEEQPSRGGGGATPEVPSRHSRAATIPASCPCLLLAGLIVGPKLKTSFPKIWAMTRAMALLALGLGPPLHKRS